MINKIISGINFKSHQIQKNSKYHISNATVSDIDSIVRITRSKENRKALPWVMKVVLNEAIEKPKNNILLVAKDKVNQVIGFIRLYCRKDKTATLHEIAIEDEFKGKGVGTELLLEAEQIVRKKDCLSINLKTPEDLFQAHKFYNKNGFKFIDTLKIKNRLLFIFSKKL